MEIERFAADFESINELRKPKKIKQDLGKGSGSSSGHGFVRSGLMWLNSAMSNRI